MQLRASPVTLPAIRLRAALAVVLLLAVAEAARAFLAMFNLRTLIELTVLISSHGGSSSHKDHKDKKDKDKEKKEKKKEKRKEKIETGLEILGGVFDVLSELGGD